MLSQHQDDWEDADQGNAGQEGYIRLALNPEERLRLIEENVLDHAIFVIDVQGRIASWNVGAESIFGYAEADVIGMDFAILFTSEDRARGVVKTEMQKAQNLGRADDERWHIRSDGVRFWASGILTCLRDNDSVLRGYVKILRDMTLRKQAERQHQEDLHRIAEQERQKAILGERNRLAREIHDTLAQGFTGISVQLEAAEDALATAPAQTMYHLNRARQLARESLAEARRSVKALRPQAFDTSDLPGALALAIQQISEGTSLHASFETEGEQISLPAEVENELLRIGQEALTNVLKHAQATRVTVRMAYAPGQLILSVEDDGIGFDRSKVDSRTTFGLLGMQERATRLNGSLKIIHGAIRGTQLLVAIPLDVISDTNS